MQKFSFFTHGKTSQVLESLNVFAFGKLRQQQTLETHQMHQVHTYTCNSKRKNELLLNYLL